MWNRLSQVSNFNPFALMQGEEEERNDETQDSLLKEKDQLIEELKTKIRESEEKLAEKTKELEEQASRFEKSKLKSKARISQLTNQLKALENENKDTPSDSSCSEPRTSPSRGKAMLYKRQLEDCRHQLAAAQKTIAELSEKNASLLAEKTQDQADALGLRPSLRSAHSQTTLPLSNEQNKGEALPSLPRPEELGSQEMYAQLVYKDARILELTNHISKQECSIMDLQETIREKDEVLRARNKAIQLLKADLAQRGQVVVDQLDDTRTHMKEMQESFAAMEADMKADRAAQREELYKLQAELASRADAIAKLEATVTTLEKAKFDLVTANADLQTRLVLLQEDKEAIVKTLHDEIDRLTSENEDLAQQNWSLQTGKLNKECKSIETCTLMDHIPSEVPLEAEFTETLHTIQKENLSLKETIKEFEEKLAAESSLQDHLNKEKIALEEEAKELAFLLEQEQDKVKSLNDLVSSLSDSISEVSDISLNSSTIDEIVALIKKGLLYDSQSSKMEHLTLLERDCKLLLNSLGLLSFKDLQDKINGDALLIDQLRAQLEKNELAHFPDSQKTSVYQAQLDELNSFCLEKQAKIDSLELSLKEHRKLKEAYFDLERKFEDLTTKSKTSEEKYKVNEESFKTTVKTLVKQKEDLEKEVRDLQCENHNLIHSLKELRSSNAVTYTSALTPNHFKEIKDELALIKSSLAEKEEEIKNVTSFLDTCTLFLKDYQKEHSRKDIESHEQQWAEEIQTLHNHLNDIKNEKSLLLSKYEKLGEESLKMKDNLNEFSTLLEICTAENQSLKEQVEIFQNVTQDLITFIQIFLPKENSDDEFNFSADDKSLSEILLNRNSFQKFISNLKQNFEGSFKNLSSSLQKTKEDLSFEKSRVSDLENIIENKCVEIENFRREIERHADFKNNHLLLEKENIALKEKMVSITKEIELLKAKDAMNEEQTKSIGELKLEWESKLKEVKDTLKMVISIKESLDQKLISQLNIFGSELDELLQDIKMAEDEITLLKKHFQKELNDLDISKGEHSNEERWNELLQNRENWRHEINLAKNTIQSLIKDVAALDCCLKTNYKDSLAKNDQLEKENFQIKNELKKFKNNQNIIEEKFNMLICENENMITCLKNDVDKATFELNEWKQYINGINIFLEEFDANSPSQEFISQHLNNILHGTCSSSQICSHNEEMNQNKSLLEHLLSGYKNIMYIYNLQNEKLGRIKNEIQGFMGSIYPHKSELYLNIIDEEEMIDEIIKTITNILNESAKSEERLKQIQKTNDEILATNSLLNEQIEHLQQKEQYYLDQVANLRSRLKGVASKQEQLKSDLEEKRNELQKIIESKDAEITNLRYDLQKCHTIIAETENRINALEIEQNTLIHMLDSANKDMNQFQELCEEKDLKLQSYQDKFSSMKEKLDAKTKGLESLHQSFVLKNKTCLDLEHSLAISQNQLIELNNTVQKTSKEMLHLAEEYQTYLELNDILQKEVSSLTTANDILVHKFDSLQNEYDKSSQILVGLNLELSTLKNQRELMFKDLESKVHHCSEKMKKLEKIIKCHSTEKIQENIYNFVDVNQEHRSGGPLAGGDFSEDSTKIIENYKVLQQNFDALANDFNRLKSELEAKESERHNLLLTVEDLESKSKLEQNKLQQSSTFPGDESYQNLKKEIEELKHHLSVQKVKNSKMLLKLKSFKDENDTIKESLSKTVDKEKYELKLEETNQLSKSLHEKEEFILSLQKQMEHNSSHYHYEIGNLNRKLNELTTMNDVLKEKIKDYKESLLEQEHQQQEILMLYKEEKAQKDSLFLQLEEIKADKIHLQEKVLDVENQVKHLENENKKLKHCLQSSEEHIKMLTHDNQTYQEVLGNLTTLKNNLEEDLRKLKESKLEEANKENKNLIEALEEQIKHFQNEGQILKAQLLALEEENKRVTSELYQKSNYIIGLQNEITLLRQEKKEGQESSASQNDEFQANSSILKLQEELETLKESNANFHGQIVQMNKDMDEKSALLSKVLKENAELSAELNVLMNHEKELREDWASQEQKWSLELSQMHSLESSSLRQLLADQTKEMQNIKADLETQLKEKDELKAALEHSQNQLSYMVSNQASHPLNNHPAMDSTSLYISSQQNTQPLNPSYENSPHIEKREVPDETTSLEPSLSLPYQTNPQLPYQELVQALIQEQQRRQELEVELQRRHEAEGHFIKPDCLEGTSSECHVLIDNEPSKPSEPSISLGKLLSPPPASRLFWWKTGRRLDGMIRRWVHPQKIIWLYLAAVHLWLIVCLLH